MLSRRVSRRDGPSFQFFVMISSSYFIQSLAQCRGHALRPLRSYHTGLKCTYVALLDAVYAYLRCTTAPRNERSASRSIQLPVAAFSRLQFTDTCSHSMTCGSASCCYCCNCCMPPFSMPTTKFGRACSSHA